MVFKSNHHEIEFQGDEVAKRAFTTLAKILKLAKTQKDRKAREEALKEAGIDPTKVNLDEEFDDIDIDSRIFLNVSKKLQKPWIIYPDNKYKQNWDLIMTL